MRDLLTESIIDVPKGVINVAIKSRQVIVKGPLGTLKRDFRHLPIELSVIDCGKDKDGKPRGKKVKAQLWFGTKKARAAVRTCTTHIKNMFKGVTKGFEYKMRMVYAHFPISVEIDKGTKKVNVVNFLGEKKDRSVILNDGVNAEKSTDQKDEIKVTGIDLDAVSQSAANIHIVARVRDKDIRKFLDGVYVSNRGTIKPEDDWEV